MMTEQITPIDLHHIEVLIAFLREATPVAEIALADAIFVFGSSSNGDLRTRLATRLWREGKAPKIVFTGGPWKKGREHPGFNTEAEFCFDLARREGVSEDALLCENKSLNTKENAQFGLQTLREAGINPKHLILVSFPAHLRRVRATFRKQFPEIEVVGSTWETLDLTPFVSDPSKWIGRLVGEIGRLERYAAVGDIVPVEIPVAVEQSRNLLKERYGEW